MPLVNPMTTGRGMNFTAVPSPVSAHDHEQHARHNRTHEETVDAVSRDDAGDYDDKRARGSADLRFGPAESGDQEAGDDGAIDAGLRSKSRGDGECHGQRKSDQSNSDSRDQVEKKFVTIVCAKTEDRLRKPIFAQENTPHSHIMAARGGIG